MKKMLLIALMLLAVSGFAIYNVGDTVDPGDNIFWTINGPTGHPDIGLSDNLFNMINKQKPVMIFFGEDW